MIGTILAAVLGIALSGGTVPSEKDLLGQWGCSDNTFVYMDKEGPLPDKKDIDANMKGMGATYDNCVLTFSEGHKLNFRVGAKSFDLKWELDPVTKEFKTTIGLFTMKGYLVQKGDRLLMVYSRSNLFMIMKFLCTSEGKKYINRTGDLLDCCKGLTLGMYFSKKKCK